jgi:16S rRNA processing protein RimM
MLAQIGAPHGVRGLLRLRSFTAEPEALLDYGALCDQAGKPVTLSIKGRAKGGFLVAVDGVDSREAAEAMKGTQLFVARAALPAPDADEFYLADLVGLTCVLEDGAVFGEIRAVEDFGAGDLLEIKPAAGGPTFYLPFTEAVVPVVDIAKGQVQVAPPDSVGEVEVGQPGGE